jgi:hypothetical protein
MNEEELKKKIRRLSKENHTKYYDDDYGEDLEIDNDKEIERLKRILEGFQKGKLEILNKLNETYPDLKTQEDRKIFVKWKEQLKKEIGEEKGK